MGCISHLASFLILIYLTISSLSWFITSSDKKKIVHIENEENFRNIIKLLQMDKVPKSIETVLISKSLNFHSNSRSTLVNIECHFYSKLIENFGIFLFSREIFKLEGGVEFQIEGGVDSVKISWSSTSNDHQKNHLIIKEFFEKFITNLKMGKKYNSSRYFVILELILVNDARFKGNYGNLFKSISNTLQIYSKRNAPFDNKIFLICSLGARAEKGFLDYNSKMLRGYPHERYFRFGAYQNERSLIKTFLFYQQIENFKNISLDLNNGNTKYLDNGNTKILLLPSPTGISQISEFLEFIIKIVMSNCH